MNDLNHAQFVLYMVICLIRISVYGLLNDAVSSSNCIVLSGRVISE